MRWPRMSSLNSVKQLRTAGTAMEKESGMRLLSGAGSMMSPSGQGAQLSFWTMAGGVAGEISWTWRAVGETLLHPGVGGRGRDALTTPGATMPGIRLGIGGQDLRGPLSRLQQGRLIMSRKGTPA